MLVKMKILGENLEVTDKTVSYYEFNCEKREIKGTLYYKSDLVMSYLVETEPSDIKPKKEKPIQETVEQFLERKKLAGKKCKGKECQELETHFGYCNYHFNLLRKYLDQNSMGFKEFEKKYLKK